MYKRQRLFFVMVCSITVIAVVTIHQITIKQTQGVQLMLDPYTKVSHTRWIVITTIQSPTPQLRALARFSGWKLLVVGDAKTPINWSVPGVIYLGTKEQKLLGYAIHDLLPYNTYVRKSIGYLFAIEHGAELIYDTDDDNVPRTDLETFDLSGLKTTTGLVIDTANLTYNPCRHFGQSTIWPRGYPLSRIALSDSHEYRSEMIHPPVIKQGFVNGDPDVDAVFRLTRKYDGVVLDISFDSAAPPVILPQGTFAPMNSQNTLYDKRAFWGLILPKTVTDRETDIYRAYWSQKLAWLLGDRIAFYPPNAFQVRNAHSYLSDFKQETAMYHRTDDLLSLLDKWQCKNQREFVKCVQELMESIVREHILGMEDIGLVNAWLQDLIKVGYKFPEIMEKRNYDKIIESDKVIYGRNGHMPVIFYANEQPSSSMVSAVMFNRTDLTNADLMESFLRLTCNDLYLTGTYTHKLSAVESTTLAILVVGVTRVTTIPYIEAIHRPIHVNILYCTSHNHSDFFHNWKLSNIQVPDSVTALSCLNAAISMKNVAYGYIYISESSLLLSQDIAALGHPWLAHITHENGNTHTASACDVGSPAISKILHSSPAISAMLHEANSHSIIDVSINTVANCLKASNNKRQISLLHVPKQVAFFVNLLTHTTISQMKCNVETLLSCVMSIVDTYTVFIENQNCSDTSRNFLHTSYFDYGAVKYKGNVNNKIFCKLVGTQ